MESNRIDITEEFLISHGFEQPVRWWHETLKQFRVYYKIEGYDCDILVSPVPQTVGDSSIPEQVEHLSSVDFIKNHHYGDWHILINSTSNHLTTFNFEDELIQLMDLCKCPLIKTQ